MRKVVVIILCLLASGCLQSCMTTKTAMDGTITKQVDLDTTIALTHLALSSMERVADIYGQYTAAQLRISEAEKAERDADRAAKIQELKDALKTLMDLRDKYNSTAAAK